MAELTTTELAERLGVTRRRALDLLGSGAVGGRRLANTAWLADADSVTRYEIASRRGSGRALAAATAWAVLWELSGLDAEWLPQRTRARVRSRIRQSDAAELAVAVSARARAHRFRVANSARAAEGLIATGRAAASVLATDLMEDDRLVSGYLRSGTVETYAAAHFMLADHTGQHVVYENTLPIVYDARAMPPAVIAADLATSIDTRERAAGVEELERLRRAWLAVN
ncbi:hypothetical protein [Agromyces aerolatus]|uniref:hypothetical protein n=1 Tax=Agromyces sp. LY-1074 TaxID=3074080 RepID=UPI00285C220B|nr:MULTISPECIES: hypothetical protein [unclassified Agromyces]MDR5699936.1 hypothetical protein [Agromyces sp. LY-1074]MDR5706252.1 hypothetical protein [Agromyces sp. LY-1358]